MTEEQADDGRRPAGDSEPPSGAMAQVLAARLCPLGDAPSPAAQGSASCGPAEAPGLNHVLLPADRLADMVGE